ncbi:MAG: hypothetical protein LM550_12825 [Candidatus Contendobacter sp.]|nr:hypothetical protein [Gammaproteobacteria bacterium]MCC8994542.1 hypothetical protein [Candidatus Contendobacter sp.]
MPTCADLGREPLAALLERYGLHLEWVAAGSEIPGSYWGDSEAGLIKDCLWVRNDTPVHSALHEACHWICMDADRRAQLHTDAGGECIEENSVCYLQILLADQWPGVIGRERMWADMDAWGYSFRLGSTRAWFEQDAEEARAWLIQQGLIDDNECPRWRVRQD